MHPLFFSPPAPPSLLLSWVDPGCVWSLFPGQNEIFWRTDNGIALPPHLVVSHWTLSPPQTRRKKEVTKTSKHAQIPAKLVPPGLWLLLLFKGFGSPFIKRELGGLPLRRTIARELGCSRSPSKNVQTDKHTRICADRSDTHFRQVRLPGLFIRTELPFPYRSF